MFNFLFGFLVIIGALIAAAYICDRLGIGMQDMSQQNTGPAIPIEDEWGRYLDYAQVMKDCVANNYSSCGLRQPKDDPQHMIANAQGIRYCNGQVQYLVIFDREILFSGRGKKFYDSTDVRKMAVQLNNLLPNYFTMAGLTPKRIVSALNMENGRVAFVLGEG